VTLLRKLRDLLLYGRPLDLTSTNNTIDGLTVPIYVDRWNLLQTTVDEILHCVDDGNDFRTPLEVTFYDERAVDLGE